MSYSAARKTYETLKDQKLWTPYWMNVHGEILGLVSEEPLPMAPSVRGTLSNSTKTESNEKSSKIEAISKSLEAQTKPTGVYSTPSSRISMEKDAFSSTKELKRTETKEEVSLFFEQISVSKKLEFTDERASDSSRNKTPSNKLSDHLSEGVSSLRAKRTKEELIEKQYSAWEWKLFPVPSSSATEEHFDIEKEDLFYSIIEKIFTDADDNPLIPLGSKPKAVDPQRVKLEKEQESHDNLDIFAFFNTPSDCSSISEQPTMIRRPPGIFPNANKSTMTYGTTHQRAPYSYYNQPSHQWPYPSKQFSSNLYENTKSNYHRNHGVSSHGPTYPHKYPAQNAMTYASALNIGQNLRK